MLMPVLIIIFKLSNVYVSSYSFMSHREFAICTKSSSLINKAIDNYAGVIPSHGILCNDFLSSL